MLADWLEYIALKILQPYTFLVSGLDANACVICGVTNHCSVVIMGKHIVILLSGVK